MVLGRLELELVPLSPGAMVVTPPERGGTGQRGALCLEVSMIPMWVSPGRYPCERSICAWLQVHVLQGASGLHPCGFFLLQVWAQTPLLFHVAVCIPVASSGHPFGSGVPKQHLVVGNPPKERGHYSST